MNKKYQIEIDNFIQRFGKYREHRIVLYGIGRYTATLLEGLDNFKIVGLMDKDSANIGKRIADIPIIDKRTAEKEADMVIINTAETYWQIIYDRIEDMIIPVYYINGERAEAKKKRKTENIFRHLSYAELLRKVEKAEVISFDFFDTLFMRCVCNPQDVFRLLEMQHDFPFVEVRDKAKKYLRENYSLDELYSQMSSMGNISHGKLEQIKCGEIAFEQSLLVPRKKMICCLKDLLRQGREIYIISDMYLPKEFYLDMLKQQGILLSSENILLSNELDTCKMDGSIWEYYLKNIVNNRQAVHVGDNEEADVIQPQKYGLEAYRTPGAWDMLLTSSLSAIVSAIGNKYSTTVMGCILKELFNNPYYLEGVDGRIVIKTTREMGYCVFGPVILTFLLWIIRECEGDGIERLVFMSRDGYFLKEDFDFLCELTGRRIDNCYLGISRQLAMISAIETKEDLFEFARMPYTGSIKELFEDRFDIYNIEESEGKSLEQYIEEHLPEIEENIAKVKMNYKKYIESFELNNSCAVVDIGYYGNNQKYLNKLTNLRMKGYYFNANLSDKNQNIYDQKMTACFQKEEDATGENSHVLKSQIYLESFLTAPYGMVKAVSADGKWICADGKGNQRFFKDKIEINSGVKQFIADYIDKFGIFDIEPDVDFVDRYYGKCFDGTMEFADAVKSGFYNDNAMMNRIESMLFY